MAGWHLDTKMAQDIVARTMRIIDTNINVMDARGRIIGSGDRERIGELHEGALLVLSQGRVVDIDDAVARGGYFFRISIYACISVCSGTPIGIWRTPMESLSCGSV